MTVKHKPEYVRSRDLAMLIEAHIAEHEDSNVHELARRAGVSPRAITKVLRFERNYQTLWFADRIMLAIGGHINELDTVRIAPKQNRSKQMKQLKRLQRSKPRQRRRSGPPTTMKAKERAR